MAKIFLINLFKDIVDLNKNSLRILGIMIEKYVVSINDLMSELKISNRELDKSVQKLREQSIVQKVMDIETNEVFLVFDSHYFTIENCICCDYFKEETKECSLKSMCSNIFENQYYRFLKQIKDKFKVCTYEVGLKGEKFKESKEVLTKDWKIKNFVDYFEEKLISKFPYSVFSKDDVRNRRTFFRLKDMFRQQYEDWKIQLKRYIDFTFEEAIKNSYHVDISTLLRSDVLAKFLKKKEKVEICNIKNIYCSFCKEGVCSLSESGIKCSDKIIDKMKRKFN